MRTCLVSLLTLAPLLVLGGATHAHIGEEIYPFYELLDEEQRYPLSRHGALR